MSTKLGLTGYESIKQSLRTLFLTSKGDVPFRPNFGLSAESLLGSSSNIELAEAVIEQIEDYEKRVQVKRVTQAVNTAGVKVVKIEYKIIETNEPQSLEIE